MAHWFATRKRMKTKSTKAAEEPQLTLPAADSEMLTKEELAAKLRVALRTIENWQHEGYLPFLKIANVVLFHWPTVLAHLQNNFSVVPPSLRTGPLSEGGKP